jgi:hypothetical protein
MSVVLLFPLNFFTQEIKSSGANVKSTPAGEVKSLPMAAADGNKYKYLYVLTPDNLSCLDHINEKKFWEELITYFPSI